MSDKSIKDQEPAGKIIDISADEKERLRRDINRSDKEKLALFVQMQRTNNLLKKAKIIHK